MEDRLSVPFPDFDIWTDFFPSPFLDHHRITTPSKLKINMVELDDKYEITADIPGIIKDDVSVTYDNYTDTLNISVKSASDRSVQNGKYYYKERFTGSTSRSIHFSRGKVNGKAIEAAIFDGVLHVVLIKNTSETKEDRINTIEVQQNNNY